MRIIKMSWFIHSQIKIQVTINLQIFRSVDVSVVKKIFLRIFFLNLLYFRTAMNKAT